MATSLIAVRLDKCQHKATGINVILPIPHNTKVVDVFNNIHGEIEGFQVKAKVSTSLKDGDLYTVHSALAIGDLKEFYSEIKTLHLKCCQTSDAEGEEKSQKPAAANTVNAFNILMSGQKVHPKKKTCNNRKDELYNDVVADMINRDLKFHKCTVDDEGTYIVQVITNSLWYLTNHHTTINEIAQRQKDVYPVPSSFDKFEGYDDYKRKQELSL